MISIENDNYVVNPPTELTIHTIEGFVENIKNELVGNRDIVLNLADISEIDSAGFQVLIALKNEALKRSVSLKINDMSPEVYEIITLYGVHTFIENNK
ncbi:MAG: hypothetical protein A2540_02850 [Sulfurimonas sp. RIFOXYD2_FULL_37_8]|nr:MAG: hypothetical protein A2540_02850 [Sulfurimonas sp. RIFOXYD2_FULL_37_8]